MCRWLWTLAAATLLADGALAAATAGPVPAPVLAASALEPAKLDELLAPIALYPDALLGQILAAAAYPQEVMDGGNWVVQHADLKGQALQDEAMKAGFGPSMQALVQFPTVLDMMCSNFDWTKQIGSAFNTDQGAVLASVQRLRAQAQAVGNLKSTKEQQVVTQTEAGQQVIIIQPADPKVIYVPTYPPTTVYTQPVQTGPTSGDVAAAAFFGFFAGVIVHSIISDSYYPCPHWGYGGFYYGGRPWGGNTYIYAPHYNYGGYRPGYRPGGPYYRPPNYPNAWNRPGNTTININSNNNYFNRFEHNNNQRPGARPAPLVSDQVRNRPDAYRPPSPGSGRPTATSRPAGVSTLPATGGATRPAPGGNYTRPANDPTYARPATRPAPPSVGTRPAPGRDTTGLDHQSAFGGVSRPAPRPAPGASGNGYGRPAPATRPAPAARPEASARPAPAARPAPSQPMARPMPAPGHSAAAQRGKASVGNGGTRPLPANARGGQR
jgi:Protein of unknown function (DUF3300)